MYGFAGDARRASIEADHVHNLPILLTHYDEALLRYYLEVMVPSYIAQAPEDGGIDFEVHWEELRAFLVTSGSRRLREEA